MPKALVLPFPRRRATRQGDSPHARPAPPGGVGTEGVQSSVEVVAPDGYSMALLMGYVSPWFPAEVVPGDSWTVRLQPPDEGEGEEWVFEVLALIERWLDAVPLPSAAVRYAERTYRIRASNDLARRLDVEVPVPEPAA
jgi:hypothetical protein